MLRGPFTRRYFVSCLGGAAMAWPLAAGAQQPGKTPRVGYIRAGTPRNDPFREEFVRGMHDLGYVEGRNMAYEFRFRRDEQIAGVQKVLGAAAWTYVAAAVCAIGGWPFYVFVLLSQRPVADHR